MLDAHGKILYRIDHNERDGALLVARSALVSGATRSGASSVPEMPCRSSTLRLLDSHFHCAWSTLSKRPRRKTLSALSAHWGSCRYKCILIKDLRPACTMNFFAIKFCNKVGRVVAPIPRL